MTAIRFKHLLFSSAPMKTTTVKSSSQLIPATPFCAQARALLLIIVFVLGTALSSSLNALTIMPVGDSGTVGVDYLTLSAGGYRDPLCRDLTAAGISFTFVGASNSNATPYLTAAGQTNHNGYGGWQIMDIYNNLNGIANPVAGGDGNLGGYFITGGNGTGRAACYPDIALFEIGANDILHGTANYNQNLYNLVTYFHSLSPNTIIFIAGIYPFANDNGLNGAIQAYDSYIKNTLVPSLSYTRYVDNYTGFLNPDGSVNTALLGADNVHPTRFGYTILASNWAAAIKAYLGTSATNYNLTVSNGAVLQSASGAVSLPAGSVMTINANAPGGGSQFASWTASTAALSNPYASLTIFTMPAATTTITANYDASGSPAIPNGTYNIVSYYDGLSAAAVGTSNGSYTVQATYTGAATQQWDLTNLGSNVVKLVLTGTNEALEDPGSSTTVSAYLDVATYTGGTNQQWTIVPILGTTEIVNVSSGQAVNILGYQTNPGAQLVQSSAGYVANQLWNFFPINGAPPATYSLTVNSGTGSGSYTAGTVVNVTANAPQSGYVFAGWTGATSALANPSASSTTLTMPAAATSITATYAPATATYSLTVNSGSGSGYYAPGTVVNVTANAPQSGYQFAGWTGATGALANPSASSTTLTMPSAATSITASYSTTSSNLFANGTYELTAQSSGLALAASGTANGSSVIQQTYTAAATQKWALTNLGNNVVELAVSGTSEALEAPGGTTIDGADLDVSSYTSATYQQWTIVSVGGGYYEVINVHSGLEANVAYNSMSSGSVICQWDAGNYGNGVWAFTAAGTVPTYVLTVTNGSGGGSYTAGTVVSVSANAPQSGYAFAGWTGATSALANPTAATTTLTMPAAATSITATYVLSGTAPATPTGLTATGGSAQVSLSWAVTSGATSYNVYRGTSTNSESTTAIATGIAATSYTDTGLAGSTTYYYKVTAVNSYGTSGYSTEANATTQTSGGGSGAVAYQDSFGRSGELVGSTPDIANVNGNTWLSTTGTGQYIVNGSTVAVSATAYPYSAAYLPVNGTSGVTLDGTKDFTLSVVITPGSTGLTGISLNTGLSSYSNLFSNDLAALATSNSFAAAYAFNNGNTNYNYGPGVSGATTISIVYSASAGTLTYNVGNAVVATQTGVTASQVAAVRAVALGDDGYGNGNALPAPTFDNFTLSVAGGNNPGGVQTTYALTVNNGTGSGSYAAGAQVTVSANAAPGGYQFSSWTGATSALANASSATTTLTMPAAATSITANYATTVTGSFLLGNGTYKLVSQSSSLAMAGGTTNGSAVTQQTYTAAATQKWTLTNLGNNVVELVVSGTAEALEVPGSSTAAGANLDVSNYAGGTNQQWTIVAASSGYYEIVNVNSGDEANVSGNSTSPGATICQWFAGDYGNGVWSVTAP